MGQRWQCVGARVRRLGDAAEVRAETAAQPHPFRITLDHCPFHPRMQIDKQGLLGHIQQQFKIDWHGIHGVSHWARVRNHGLRVGEQMGADLLVVELFALLHDSCRWNEHRDPLHGERGAEFTKSLQGQFFDLSAPQLDTLTYAIRYHSDGAVSSNATIQACWDGDRLDLGRVGIQPSAVFLSKVAAGMVKGLGKG